MIWWARSERRILIKSERACCNSSHAAVHIDDDDDGIFYCGSLLLPWLSVRASCEVWQPCMYHRSQPTETNNTTHQSLPLSLILIQRSSTYDFSHEEQLGSTSKLTVLIPFLNRLLKEVMKCSFRFLSRLVHKVYY